MFTCMQVDGAMKKGDVARLPALENELEMVSFWFFVCHVY